MVSIYQAAKMLADAGVEFVIVGGFALRSHGSGYLTQDLDICYSRTRANLERIADALAPFDILDHEDFRMICRSFGVGRHFRTERILHSRLHCAISTS